jgi:hypothetical protein
MRAVLALACAMALCGCANQPWDTTDRALGYAALAVTTADWAQARYIARNPAQYQENNSILSAHPSSGQVDAYFACAIGGGYLLADALPSTYRKFFLGGAAVFELSVVLHNRSIGVGVRF